MSEREDVMARWADVDQATLQRAVDQTLEAFGADHGVGQAVKYLQAYYDPGSDYAGELFLSSKPNQDDTFGPADFWAVSTLNVSIGRYSARQLAGPGATGNETKRTLRDIGSTRTLSTIHADLASGDDELLVAMATFYRSVKRAIAPRGKEESSNRWVTASKLCARKRPALFPIRDRVVCEYLGIIVLNDFVRDWRVFHHLITHAEVKDRLRAAVDGFREAGGVTIDWENLRVLDVVLWMHGMSQSRTTAPVETSED